MKLKRTFACTLILCMLACMLPVSVSANNPGVGGFISETYLVDDVMWSYNSDNCTLTISGTGRMAGLDGVSGDGWCNAPWADYKITKVIIKDGVTNIGAGMFAYMGASHEANSLHPDGVEYTPFTLEMADSVTSIDSFAFWGASLTDIQLSGNLTHIDGGAFAYCDLTSIDFPDSLTEADLSGMYKLKEVVIPDKVKSLGSFFECTSLEKVTFGMEIETLSPTIFGSAAMLKEVYFTGDAPTLSSENSDGLGANNGVTLYYPSNNPTWTEQARNALQAGCTWKAYDLTESGDCSATAADNVRWSFNKKTGELTISGTGAMKEYEFYGDGPSATPWREYELKKVVIEDGVTSISLGAFAFMGGSFTVEMADSVVRIGKSAFSSSGLTDIRLSENLTQLGSGALQFTGLKNLVIPDSVKALPQYAFIESGLQTITIGKGITMIDYTMLQKCVELTTIYFTGDAPDTDYGLNTNPYAPMYGTKLTIYYPANNATWTQEKKAALATPLKDFTYEWIEYIPCKTGYTHAVNEVAAKAATYTESGNIQHYTCGNCGKLFADSEAKTQILDAASVVIPKLVHAHALKEVPAKAATYTADGNMRYYTCTGCDKLFADSEAKTVVDAAAVVITKLVQIQQNTVVLTDDAVEQAITAGKTDVVLPLEQLGTAIAEVVLSAEAVETVSKLDQSSTLTIPLDDVVVTLDNKTMQTILKNADGKEETTLQLQVKKIDAAQLNQVQQNVIKDSKVAVVISANMTSGGKDIHDFEGGTVTISVPFALPANANAGNYKVLYVADDGKTEDVAAAYKDGKFVFTVSHFSEYVIVETKQSATPVTGDSFAAMPVLGIMIASAVVLALLVANKKRLYQ